MSYSIKISNYETDDAYLVVSFISSLLGYEWFSIHCYRVVYLYIFKLIYICSYVTSAAKLRHASWIILNNIALTYMHACSDQKTSTGVMHVKCVFARKGSKPICNNSLNNTRRLFACTKQVMLS